MRKLMIAKTIGNKIAMWQIQLTDNTVYLTYGTLNDKNDITWITTSASHVNSQKAKDDYLKRITRKANSGYIEIQPLDEIIFSVLYAALPEFKVDANSFLKPMKAQPFRPNVMKYPALGQAKLNGCRAKLVYLKGENSDLFAEDGNGFALLSKEGIRYNVPHITDHMNGLMYEFPDLVNYEFDGEIYCYGEKSTSVTGAARNRKNPLNKHLVFITFDLMTPNMPQSQRIDELKKLATMEVLPILIVEGHAVACYDMGTTYTFLPIYILDTFIVKDDETAQEIRDRLIKYQYEGIILRDMDEEYHFGQRPSTMLKWKKELYAMFEVVDIVPRNETDGIPQFVLKNDLNDNVFDASMTGSNLIKFSIMERKQDLIGTKVLLKFYERTINEQPFHHNVLYEFVLNILKQLDNEEETTKE